MQIWYIKEGLYIQVCNVSNGKVAKKCHYSPEPPPAVNITNHELQEAYSVSMYTATATKAWSHQKMTSVCTHVKGKFSVDVFTWITNDEFYI
jgi:hypothetical protein